VVVLCHVAVVMCRAAMCLCAAGAGRSSLLARGGRGVQLAACKAVQWDSWHMWWWPRVWAWASISRTMQPNVLCRLLGQQARGAAADAAVFCVCVLRARSTGAGQRRGASQGCVGVQHRLVSGLAGH
jgi:hypothetical protein